ncbi:cysteine hydrolase family protein [Penicillium alfredii]|uniref:Cysteine hydrolase family protein n=1 Tax=Penicillium alfredii TaxID=1506179 RepID=A0A9W9F8X2_9EURO|nr:cysteine hydrolase family protein [Penicillium alfredii]KAJ5095825.1 cysteine hydrolase family protein [Penicillium alfredii]
MASAYPNFGPLYAILHLDWGSALIGAVQETPEEQALITNYTRWNNAVHQKIPRPVTIFTTLAFSQGQPEVKTNTPFANLIAPFGAFETGTPEVQIDSRFTLDEKDLVFPKKRWSATTGNALEHTLKSQKINTVVIVSDLEPPFGRLFDLDYRIYVIADNVLDLPVHQNAEFKKVIIDSLLPKMNLDVISLEEALQALEQSA